MILAGLICVNLAELHDSTLDIMLKNILSVLPIAFMAVACWTWYPMRNANWLRVNSTKKPCHLGYRLGVFATLPLAMMGYALVWYQLRLTQPTDMPFGPRPWIFIALMSAIGLLCSWLGALCWNQASQRLPTALAGQLIVFETLAGLTYAFLLRQEFPSLLTVTGVVLLMSGVLKSFRCCSGVE